MERMALRPESWARGCAVLTLTSGVTAWRSSGGAGGQGLEEGGTWNWVEKIRAWIICRDAFRLQYRSF